MVVSTEPPDCVCAHMLEVLVREYLTPEMSLEDAAENFAMVVDSWASWWCWATEFALAIVEQEATMLD